MDTCPLHVLLYVPTRRASDLGPRIRVDAASPRLWTYRCRMAPRTEPPFRSRPPPTHARARRPADAARASAPVRERRRGGRSEEHTSELQSPCNLVCRLLLEKK